MSRGKFVISLDFEKYWGMRDKKPLASYKQNLKNVDKVVERTLELFEQYHIKCTWATVGMLFNNNYQEHSKNIPDTRPFYMNQNLDPYHYLENLEPNNFSNQYHSATRAVSKIKEAVGQELASHTYSHLYMLEEGIDIDAIKSDLEKFNELSENVGLEPRSIVFPRNQYNEKVLNILIDYGIKTYRGNENSWLYRPSKNDEQGYFRRMVRLLDAIVNISGHHFYKVNAAEIPLNIPSSRLLRPITRNKIFDSLHLNRVKQSMKKAAANGAVYHLWWHPHNFGNNMEFNFERLEEILQHFKLLQNEFGFESYNMSDFIDD